MYKVIKSILSPLLQTRLFKQNKQRLRKLIYPFYKGTNYNCNICNKGLKGFISVHSSDLLCPYCGCLGRTRNLHKLLKSVPNHKNILHFSPSEGIASALKKQFKNYTTSDFVGEFNADKKFDITNIESPNNQYDIIICYHVLEHIIEDKKAIQELYRITTKGGTCYIQTPFKKGDIYEDFSITSASERLKHFEQEDHVRTYSANGLANRLTLAGFEVEIKVFKNDPKNKFGLSLHETVLIATKK